MTRERTQHRYSVEVKERLVAEIEAGHLSLREAARTAQASVAMVHQWLGEYGRYQPKRDVVEVVMKSEQDQIAALEKALADAHLKLRVYDELITHANRVYKTDLKKSFGSPSLAPFVGVAVTSPRSAPPSRTAATPTTSGSPVARPTPALRKARGR